MLKKSNKNETKEEAKNMQVPNVEDRTSTMNGRQGTTGVTK